MTGPPPTRYAKSGDVHIAYQVMGDGPFDLVLVPGFVSHVEVAWERPDSARFLRRLASFSRLIGLDTRGSGLSDRVTESDFPTLEERMDDIGAVMDAVGSERAAIFGMSEGGWLSLLFAATYPERTTALLLYGVSPLPSPDLLAAPPEVRELLLDAIRDQWGTGILLPHVAPSLAGSAPDVAWWARYERMAVSPSAAKTIIKRNLDADVRDIPVSVHVPTLVLRRADDRSVDERGARSVADAIEGATYVELPGADHLPFVGDQESLVGEIQQFLTGVRGTPETERILATVLFTDIVESTRRAAELGDHRWHEVLGAHDELVRRQLERFRGREVRTTGDGFVATFDGPARGVRCAQAVVEGVRGLGLEVRAGLHTGECEVREEGQPGGFAFHVAARVHELAGPGEVWVSSTVRDLVAGSGIRFLDHGMHSLKGVPEQWHLYEVAAE